MTRDERESAVLLRLAGLAGLGLMFAAVGFVFWAYNKEFRKSVQLPNGLNIGYEAVFDLSGPYWVPIAVPRFPDGEPLVRADVWLEGQVYVAASKSALVWTHA